MLKIDVSAHDNPMTPRSPAGSLYDVAPEFPKTKAPTINYDKIRYPNMAEANAYQNIMQKMDRDLRTNSIYNDSPIARGISPRMKKSKKRQSTLGIMLNSAKGFILNTNTGNNDHNIDNNNKEKVVGIISSSSNNNINNNYDNNQLVKELADTKEILHEQQKIMVELMQILKRIASDDKHKKEIDILLEKNFKLMLPK